MSRPRRFPLHSLRWWLTWEAVTSSLWGSNSKPEEGVEMNMKKRSQPGLSGNFPKSLDTDPKIPGTEGAEDFQPAVEVAAEVASLPCQDQQIMGAIRNAMVMEGKLQEGRIFLSSRGDSQVEILRNIPNQKPVSYGVYKLV